MLLPIRTSIRPRQTPYANYALIILNIFFFLLTYIGQQRVMVHGHVELRYLRHSAEQFMLHPSQPILWQFVTYAFLHGGVMHILGNMYFLYLFGNNVNGRLGNISYLCLFLGGAVFAGLGHVLLHPNPVLGASGAVAAVVGAYLVLFPQSLITVLYFFFFIGTIEISALYFIIFKLIVWDNLIEPNFSHSAIAYSAHLAGYVFGIAAVLILLSTRLISSSGFDLFSMIKQWNRRRQYRDVVSNSYDPFTGTTAAKKIKAKQIKTPAQRQQEDKINQLRNEIADRIAQRNLSAAAQSYLQLLEVDSSQIPPRQYLLDIANQLASENRHAESAQAYEKFLAHYSTYEYIEQVELMLGIISLKIGFELALNWV